MFLKKYLFDGIFRNIKYFSPYSRVEKGALDFYEFDF